jgi:hypothetical protein
VVHDQTLITLVRPKGSSHRVRPSGFEPETCGLRVRSCGCHCQSVLLTRAYFSW